MNSYQLNFDQILEQFVQGINVQTQPQNAFTSNIIFHFFNTKKQPLLNLLSIQFFLHLDKISNNLKSMQMVS